MREALGKETLKHIYAGVAHRYDLQHGLITAGADQRGRRMLVDRAVSPGDQVLDCGAGTGSTGILAAKKVGGSGKVTFFDLSDDMLECARQKIEQAGLLDRASFQAGDLVQLPFETGSFDVVLSTYSLCPIYDPAEGALELYRVTRPGGKVGIAHSTEPTGAVAKWLADKVEDIAWRIPSLSMGCRSVNVLPALAQAGARILFARHIGVPLWPFFVFAVEKPAADD